MGASCHQCLRINEDTIQYNTIPNYCHTFLLSYYHSTLICIIKHEGNKLIHTNCSNKNELHKSFTPIGRITPPINLSWEELIPDQSHLVRGRTNSTSQLVLS